MKDSPRHKRKRADRRPGARPGSRLKKIARLIADPNDARSLNEKLDSVGLTDEAFSQILSDRKFLVCLNRLIEKFTDLERSQIWKALIEAAKDGDIRAIKLYFELKKESKEKLPGPESEEITIKWLNCEGQGDEKNVHQLPPDGDAGSLPRLKKPLQAAKSRKKGGQDHGRGE